MSISSPSRFSTATLTTSSASKLNHVHLRWDDAFNAALATLALYPDGRIACVCSPHDLRLLFSSCSTTTQALIYADEGTHVHDVTSGFADLPTDANEFQLYDVDHMGLRPSVDNVKIHLHSPLQHVQSQQLSSTEHYPEIQLEQGACTLLPTLLTHITSILLVYPATNSIPDNHHDGLPLPLSLHIEQEFSGTLHNHAVSVLAVPMHAAYARIAPTGNPDRDIWHSLLAHGLALQMRWDFGIVNEVEQLRYGAAFDIVREHARRCEQNNTMEKIVQKRKKRSRMNDRQDHETEKDDILDFNNVSMSNTTMTTSTTTIATNTNINQVQQDNNKRLNNNNAVLGKVSQPMAIMLKQEQKQQLQLLQQKQQKIRDRDRDERIQRLKERNNRVMELHSGGSSSEGGVKTIGHLDTDGLEACELGMTLKNEVIADEFDTDADLRIVDDFDTDGNAGLHDVDVDVDVVDPDATPPTTTTTGTSLTATTMTTTTTTTSLTFQQQLQQQQNRRARILSNSDALFSSRRGQLSLNTLSISQIPDELISANGLPSSPSTFQSYSSPLSRYRVRRQPQKVANSQSSQNSQAQPDNINDSTTSPSPPNDTPSEPAELGADVLSGQRFVVHGRAEMLRDSAPQPELLDVLLRILQRSGIVALGVPGLSRSHLLIRRRRAGSPTVKDVNEASKILTRIRSGKNGHAIVRPEHLQIRRIGITLTMLFTLILGVVNMGLNLTNVSNAFTQLLHTLTLCLCCYHVVHWICGKRFSFVSIMKDGMHELEDISAVQKYYYNSLDKENAVSFGTALAGTRETLHWLEKGNTKGYVSHVPTGGIPFVSGVSTTDLMVAGVMVGDTVKLDFDRGTSEVVETHGHFAYVKRPLSVEDVRASGKMLVGDGFRMVV